MFAVSCLPLTSSDMTAALNIDSPCKLICTLDITSGVCTGCGRTRGDIAAWMNYSRAQKAFANNEAEKRMRVFASKEDV